MACHQELSPLEYEQVKNASGIRRCPEQADPDLRVIVHSDGAARGNPGPAGIGAVVTSPSGEVLAEVAEGIGVATNNVAEYRAAIEGLRAARDLGAHAVTLRADSRLLIEQLKGNFRVKNPTLQRLHQEARTLFKESARSAWSTFPARSTRMPTVWRTAAWTNGWPPTGGWRPPEADPKLL